MSTTRYPASIAWLHWLIAVLIFAAIGLGLSMVDLPFSPTKIRWYSWHKWLGITVLVLAAVRLLLRRRAILPGPVAMPDWQRKLAAGAHHFLYLMMFAIPLSGWMYSSAAGVPVVYLGVLPLPNLMPVDKQWAAVLKTVHTLLNYTMFVILAAHIAGALKHQFVDRDGLLMRMLPWPPRKRAG